MSVRLPEIVARRELLTTLTFKSGLSNHGKAFDVEQLNDLYFDCSTKCLDDSSDATPTTIETSQTDIPNQAFVNL